MDCPKCIGKLEDHTIEDLDVYCCFVCEGLWFDAGELEEVLKRDSKDFDYIDVGQEEYSGAEVKAEGIDLSKKLGKCPRCTDGTVMKKAPYEKNHKVMIDICPKGHGIWLDGGEIQQLRHRGLVKIHDHFEYYMQMCRTIFTPKGIASVLSRGPRVIEDRAEGIDPRKDPKLGA